MQITIKGKNCEIPDELREYTESKISKLTRYLSRLQSASVVFTENASKNRERSYRSEVVAHAPGQTLKIEEERESFQVAIDAAVDKLKRQLKKLKTKRIDRTREHPGLAAVVNASVGEPKDEEAGSTIEVKKFTLKPMSVHEAIMRLDISERDFFLFVNDQSSFNCVYKRGDGRYGLLVPETDA
ncbi:ribosome-associated translation inhibitor RaiA [bacterium]|nr:ribosome-associated translation inhibitor RaiA [bacterium]